MKINLLKTLTTGATALAAALFASSCQDYTPEFDIDKVEHEAFLASGLTDFATREGVTFSINYNKPDANNPVLVYDEYPYDEDGKRIKGVDPVYAFFLENGTYNGTADLPIASSHLWLAAGGIGLPTLQEVDVYNGQVFYSSETTRAIESNQLYYETKTETVFANGTGHTNLVRHEIGGGSDNQLTFPDGKTYTRSYPIKTNGYFEFPADHDGVIKVYCANPNTASKRTIILSKGTEFSTKTECKRVATQETDPLLVTCAINKDEHVFVHSEGSFNVYAITFSYNTDVPNSDILTTADYTYQTGEQNGRVEAESSVYGDYYKKVYALYPWSVTGMPEVSRPTYVDQIGGATEFPAKTYSWNALNTPAVHNGIDCYIEGEINNDGITALPNVKWASGWLTSVTINPTDQMTLHLPTGYDGDLKLHVIGDMGDGEFIIDGNEATFNKDTENNILYQYIGHTGDRVITLKSSVVIDRIDFVPKTNSNISQWACFASGLCVTNSDDSPVKISFDNKLKVKEYIKGSTVAGNTFGYDLRDTKTDFRFDLPAYVKAKLSISFAKQSQPKSWTISVNGQNVKMDVDPETFIGTTYLSTSQDAETFIITRGSGTATAFFEIQVEYVDEYTVNNYHQTVKRFPKYDDSSLQSEEKLQAVTDRLTNMLWYGEPDKWTAEDVYGASLNKQRALEQGNGGTKPQCTTITNATGTKLYVTFLAEHNMRACSSLAYFICPKDPATMTRADIANLDLYVIFPNCTSTDYSNSLTYKKNGSYGLNESLVPLSNGDQVQLMYPLGNGEFSETFPQNTVVGWCLIYNGYDGWDASTGTMGTRNIRLGMANNNGYTKSDGSHYETATSKLYYSIPGLNDGDQPRCLAFTDEITKQVSLCWEDSYSGTGAGDTKQDWTYDDLIFTVTATNNEDMETPGVEEGPTKQTLTYAVKGVSVFEDIWNGNITDFDMNDVAIKYRRDYTITRTKKSETEYDNRLIGIHEKYTLMNDGATYDDGFAIRLPYTPEMLQSIVVTPKDQEDIIFDPQTMATTSEVPTPDLTVNRPRLEKEQDSKDPSKYYLNLVFFDNINLFDDEDMGTMTWNVVYNVKDGGIELAEDNIKKEDGKDDAIDGSKFSFRRNQYNPFIIVYTDKRTDGKRCEIHQPTFGLTNFGIPSGAVRSDGKNNRWNIAIVQGNPMPFALDISSENFVSPHEGTPINNAYSQFLDWAINSNNNKDWYKSPDNEKIGWDRVQ